jgi:hypothetical protein
MWRLMVSLLALPVIASTVPVFAQESEFDVRARETEQQMTDDERFSLIVSLIGAVPSIGVPRDKRIPEGVAMSAGYTPGIPRFDGAANQWRMTDGTHEVALGKSAGDLVLTGSANLTGRLFGS